MSGIVVGKDIISWPRYSINAEGNDLIGDGPAFPEYPAYLIFREMASLGKAGDPGSNAAISAEDLYSYAEIDEKNVGRMFSDLGLPELYKGPAFLEASGPIGAPGLNLRLFFPEAISELGPYGDSMLKPKGMLIVDKDEEIVFSSPPSLYRLIEAVKKFNLKSKEEQPLEEKLLAIGRINTLAMKAGTTCDQVIQSERIDEPGRIRLDVVEHQNKVSIIPEIDIQDLPAGSFGEKFKNRLTVSGVMNFDSPEGRIRVVLPETYKKALSRIKNEMQSIAEPEKLRAILENPPQEFDDVDIDISALYSERVKGLGIYRPKTWPFICPYHTEWLPGIMIEGVDGKRSCLVKDENDLVALEDAIGRAKKDGKDYAEFMGERIDLVTAGKVADAAHVRLSAPVTDVRTVSEKLKVLLIDENIEDLEYSEESNDDSFNDNPCEIKRLDESTKLKPHQQKGISRLAALYDTHHSGAILADDMGLGKTLQALAFLEYLAERPEGILACVISPVGLLANWIDEYEKYFPEGELAPVNLMNNRNLLNEIKGKPSLYTNRLFFLSYEMMRRNQLEICAIPWDVVILDEAQKIKTPGTLVTNAAKALKARFKLALTGTPVENTFHDLWCISDFALPGLLGSARTFASEYNPAPNEDELEIRRKGEELRRKLGRRFIRRLKNDVLDDLPPKWESDNPEHIKEFFGLSTTRLMPEQQHLTYDKVIKDYQSRSAQENISQKRGILDVLYLLKSVCEHPLFIEHDEDFDAVDHLNDSAKASELIEILDHVKNRGEKAIVFAEYRRTQRFLATIIHARYRINPSIINGDTPVGFSQISTNVNRLGLVKSFNQRSGFDVIIMSPIAAGVGLNVTGANHVIHFSRHWNPSKEDQATDRAYRIGQTRPVYVYYLIARHPNENIKSFDDNLASLLFAKRGLRSAVLYPSEKVEIKPEDMLNSEDTV